jgi:spore maturation protein CgeB
MMAMAEVPSGIEPLAPLLDQTIAALGIHVPPDQRRDLAYQCLMVARHVDRVRVADRMLAADIPVALYGRGWAEIERFAPHARGLIEPGDALRRMYQRHKVVLHINTRCNLHPRVLEAAAAGGFVLARSDGEWDFAPGSVGDYLVVGRELCVFDDGDDMVAKIRRAFTDETWRRDFVESARARVHLDHTYAQRAQRMLAALDHRLAAVLGKADAA